MYLATSRRLLNQGQALQSFVNTSRERSVLPLLLSIAALCQPFFQVNDEVERRDLPEQGFWASPKSHWDGVNQCLFEFVEDLPDVSVPCRTQASIAFKACLRLFTGSFRISSSSICSFFVSGRIQVIIEI